ncbi:histone-lysine N-methyltransferase ATXR3-like [Andrographis paniculata]|uniref:histone-lysine N-methyltransferase ATXR3-like n=1 Tax=Andrographis paniculata TaxID=175694 RepID=UPI0021E83579|nr:histone-lysine N-methyltransferase ATXR3-like [Andrographis paniculata]
MNLKTKIHARGSFGPDFQQTKFQNSLKWLRDVVRKLHSTYKRRNDAAGDVIHIYARTKCFLRLRKYKKVVSPPVHITPQDLSPKYAEKLGSGDAVLTQIPEAITTTCLRPKDSEVYAFYDEEKTPNALAGGPDMVIQELPEHCWQPNTGCCATQGLH